MTSMTWRTRLNILLSVVMLLAFIAVFFTDPSIRSSAPLYTMFFAFFFIFITDRVGAIMADTFSDTEANELRGKITLESEQTRKDLERLPNLFGGRHDIVTFPTSVDALKYCIAVCSLAIDVKNTVLRYGISTSVNPRLLYDSWISEKRKSLDGGRCVWTEIVSSHLTEDDPEITFIREVDVGVSYYAGHYLDDFKHPMLQMTIFTFDTAKEILFGFEFPGIRQGPVFLTKNEKLIDYFEHYFSHYQNICIKEATEQSQEQQF